MKDLITEARELCEKATPGPWVSENMKLSRAIIGGTLELLNWASDKPFYTKQDFDFIARSRTIIPELCDALEKAETRGKGCEHCRGWDKRCGANYCPMCGRELEDRPCG